MSDLEKRLEDLEFRYAHQETALEEMHELVLKQERELETLRIGLKEVLRRMNEAAPSNVAAANEEAPPPHY
ncbi:MAG: SlyX family protein [Gammaproteobacteria bacterium]